MADRRKNRAAGPGIVRSERTVDHGDIQRIPAISTPAVRAGGSIVSERRAAAAAAGVLVDQNLYITDTR